MHLKRDPEDGLERLSEKHMTMYDDNIYDGFTGLDVKALAVVRRILCMVLQTAVHVYLFKCSG